MDQVRALVQELRDAIAQKNADSARGLIHRLKFVVGSFDSVNSAQADATEVQLASNRK